MSMKNDLSFLISEMMNFYEQQSSYNPNMPIRFLVSAGMIYSKYIETNHINIYSSAQKKLPVPKLICFYNGLKEMEDCSHLSLSSAFPEGSEPDIEVRVKMLNINYGRNMDLLNMCEPLRDYSWLIDRVRYHMNLTGDIEASVDMAISELPEESVLKPFLIEHKAEVKSMCITEYDETKTMNMFREEGREEGRVEGREEGREEGQIQTLVSLAGKKIITVEQAAEEAGMTVDEFLEKMRVL